MRNYWSENSGDSLRFWLLSSLLIALYLWLTCVNLSLPGLHYDEVLQGNPAVRLVVGEFNGNYNIVWEQRLFGRRFPIMNMEYMGALKTWMLAVGFKLFGINLAVHRGVGILCSAIGLLFILHFARRLWGSWIAITAVALLITDITFIFCTRLDWGPVAIAFLMRCVTFWALAKWYQGDNPDRNFQSKHWFWIASAAVGIGLFDKTNFLWFILALVPIVAALWWTNRKRLVITFRDFLIAAGIGFVCSLPLWVFNLVTGFRTFRMAKMPGEALSLAGLFELAPSRFNVLVAMFNGHNLDDMWFGQTLTELPLGQNSWLTGLSVIALGGLIILACLKRRWDLFLLPALILLMLVQIFLVPRPVWVHHWIGIYPLPHLAVALFFHTLGSVISRERAVKILGSVIIIGAVCVNLSLWRGYQQQLLKTGGIGVWTDAIYGLNESLQNEYPASPICVMDWGISNQLLFLSKGQLRLQEPFWNYIENAVPQEPLLSLVRDSKNIFVLHTNSRESFSKPREALFEAARQAGLQARIEKKFQERTGKDIFEIVTFGRE